MRSSELRLAVVAALVGLTTASPLSAAGPPAAQGFGVERFYPSAPGAGWLVMDELDLGGPLGGAMAMTTSYAHDPLVVDQGAHRLAVVSDEAFTDFSFAATYDRWRVHVGFDVPLVIQGDSGTASGYAFTAPAVWLGPNTDTLTDLRIGVDARILGDARSAFRMGAGAQLLVPEGLRSDYDSDQTPRAMLRLLAAGDWGLFTYAAQAGVHIRPLDDPATPGSPRGSELLFGVAAGARVSFGRGGTPPMLVIGPEIYGESALGSLFDAGTTGVEGLLSTRLETTLPEGSILGVRVGTGPGIDAHFGAPAWRAVIGLELSDHVRAKAH